MPIDDCLETTEWMRQLVKRWVVRVRVVVVAQHKTNIYKKYKKRESCSWHHIFIHALMREEFLSSCSSRHNCVCVCPEAYYLLSKVISILKRQFYLYQCYSSLLHNNIIINIWQKKKKKRRDPFPSLFVPKIRFGSFFFSFCIDEKT